MLEDDEFSWFVVLGAPFLMQTGFSKKPNL